MRIDALRIRLRPRTHAQALDLGMALLRAHAGPTYRAWLALWLPLGALVMALTWYWPAGARYWYVLAWWGRPWLERAPLYVLARAVFGEEVGWRAAVRAWPRELGGGTFRLLTWWPPLMLGRGLYQPVWQLERARGAAASARLSVLGRAGTGAAAWRFGAICALFQVVLLAGFIGLLGLFMAAGDTPNPFTLFNPQALAPRAYTLLNQLGAVLAGAVMGPVYVAGCFTLYLNRRVMLEAWDIEIVLRQLRAPAAAGGAGRAAALLAGVALAGAVALAPPPARAAAPDCAPPPFLVAKRPQRGPDQDPDQRALRQEVETVFADPDLRDYRCITEWQLKDKPPKPPQVARRRQPEWNLAGTLLEATLVAALVALAGWLLYRYRDALGTLLALPRRAPALATVVAGLDITAESLPADVAGQARASWAAGQRRAALALLYRATLSRLVHEDGVAVPAGATEGDCLRLARAAAQAHRLAPARMQVAAAVTAMWQGAAYGERWPGPAGFEEQCGAWQAAFERSSHA